MTETQLCWIMFTVEFLIIVLSAAVQKREKSKSAEQTVECGVRG